MSLIQEVESSQRENSSVQPYNINNKVNTTHWQTNPQLQLNNTTNHTQKNGQEVKCSEEEHTLEQTSGGIDKEAAPVEIHKERSNRLSSSNNDSNNNQINNSDGNSIRQDSNFMKDNNDDLVMEGKTQLLNEEDDPSMTEKTSAIQNNSSDVGSPSSSLGGYKSTILYFINHVDYFFWI